MSDAIPRLFVLQRDRDVTGVSGPGPVADGVEWPDGTMALRWRERPSTSVWDSLDLMLSVHGHDGATRVVWADDRARAAAGRAYLLADRWQAAHGSSMFLVRAAGAKLRDVLGEALAEDPGLAAAECSAQYPAHEASPRLCIRAAQHRGDHIDEHGFHWSDSVAVYPAASSQPMQHGRAYASSCSNPDHACPTCGDCVRQHPGEGQCATPNQGALAGIEVRDPCPWCEDCPLIPRTLMSDHIREHHPEVREGAPVSRCPTPFRSWTTGSLRNALTATSGSPATASTSTSPSRTPTFPVHRDARQRTRQPEALRVPRRAPRGRVRQPPCERARRDGPDCVGGLGNGSDAPPGAGRSRRGTGTARRWHRRGRSAKAVRGTARPAGRCRVGRHRGRTAAEGGGGSSMSGRVRCRARPRPDAHRTVSHPRPAQRTRPRRGRVRHLGGRAVRPRRRHPRGHRSLPVLHWRPGVPRSELGAHVEAKHARVLDVLASGASLDERLAGPEARCRLPHEMEA